MPWVRKHLNTHIVEQYWRSEEGKTTGIELICDTGVSQGIYLDALAILGTNLTSSAKIQVICDDELKIPLRSLGMDKILWVSKISPEKPYKTFTLTTDDPTNLDGFIKIGTILLGSSTKLEFKTTDSITITHKEFKDEIKTEGATTYVNSGGYSRGLRFDFRDLELSSRD